MKVRDIIEICNGNLILGELDMICENFSKDTRTIQKDDVYIGIKGERFDGNLLFKEAFEKGAKVCIIQGVDITKEIKEQYSDRCIIIVNDTIKALQQIASYQRSLYHIPVIAITGSVGKTSTKDMIASVVGTSYQVLKTEGNLNNHIGLPMTILKLRHHDALVVEMGMNNLGEISVLSKIAKPNIAVITNIGTAHIGNLGSRENILKAKLEILDGLQKDGVLIINNDNDLLSQWKQNIRTDIKICTFGIENDSDVLAKDINQTEHGYEFETVFKDYHDNEHREKIAIHIAGKHYIYNALSAIAVGKILRNFNR